MAAVEMSSTSLMMDPTDLTIGCPGRVDIAAGTEDGEGVIISGTGSGAVGSGLIGVQGTSSLESVNEVARIDGRIAVVDNGCSQPSPTKFESIETEGVTE